jgi:hypothetical protein
MSMDCIGAPLENLTARVPSGNGVCGEILARMGVDVLEVMPDVRPVAGVPPVAPAATWKPVVGQP